MIHWLKRQNWRRSWSIWLVSASFIFSLATAAGAQTWNDPSTETWNIGATWNDPGNETWSDPSLLNWGPSAGHSVALTWTGPLEATSYNAYSSPQSGGPYVLTASTSAQTWTDRSVHAGQLVFYVVTSVNANGESGYSNEVSAVIPSP